MARPAIAVASCEEDDPRCIVCGSITSFHLVCVNCNMQIELKRRPYIEVSLYLGRFFN